MRQRPLLNKTYCILMPLRSGNTSLTRRIARRDQLSRPDEYVNTVVLSTGRDVFEVFDVIAREKPHA